MVSKGRGQSKIPFKVFKEECRRIFFECKKNIFWTLFSNLADSLLQKLPHPKNKLWIKIIEEYYKQIQNKRQDFILHNVEVTLVEMILKSWDVAKVSGIYQISAKFLNGAPVIAIYLTSIINLSKNFDTFPWQYEIAIIKSLFKEGIKTEAKR